MSVVTAAVVFLALAVAIAIGVGLAYVPMRLLVGRMARDISNFIQRQRDRRRVERGTPDRRHT
jgi:MFS superfamily sulfate permease-like transporter